MHSRKFEVDELTIDFYVTQIRNTFRELRLNYWHHYTPLIPLGMDSIINLGAYRKGADIDILSDLLYTLCRVQNVYIEAIKSGEFYSISDCDIIEINEDI
jgi:hypothetical protein